MRQRGTLAGNSRSHQDFTSAHQFGYIRIGGPRDGKTKCRAYVSPRPEAHTTEPVGGASRCFPCGIRVRPHQGGLAFTPSDERID
jgi:hypothetical protein